MALASGVGEEGTVTVPCPQGKGGRPVGRSFWAALHERRLELGFCAHRARGPIDPAPGDMLTRWVSLGSETGNLACLVTHYFCLSYRDREECSSGKLCVFSKLSAWAGRAGEGCAFGALKLTNSFIFKQPSAKFDKSFVFMNSSGCNIWPFLAPLFSQTHRDQS